MSSRCILLPQFSSCGPQRLWVARESDLQKVPNPHVSSVLPVDRVNHFYYIHVPLSFKYMQMQKRQPLDNATEFNAFFCIYVFSHDISKSFRCTCVDEMIFRSERYLSLWMETFNKIFSFPVQYLIFENHFLKKSCSEFNFHQSVCHITLNSLFNLSLYQYIVRYTVQALGPMISR